LLGGVAGSTKHRREYISVRNAHLKENTMKEFDEWYEENEDEIYISAAESGADRELDYDAEAYAERMYDQYCLLNI